MSLFRLPLVALLLLVGAATSASAQVRTAQLPEPAELARYGLVRVWWNRATINPYRDKIRSVACDEQAVYVQTTAGNVTAFDSETGRLMWSKLVGTPTQSSFPLTSNDSFVFMAAGMNLYCIDKASGETMWNIKLPHSPSASPEVDDDTLFIGTTDGSVYAYSLPRIKELYDRRMLPQYSELAIRWRYQAPSEIISPPVSNGEAVVFASYSGLLFSVQAKNRGLNYQFETEGRAPIRVPVGRSENMIYVASDDARVFALDMINGNRRWSFTAGEPVRQQPRVVGGSVFIVPSGRGMYSLKAATGLQQWHQREATEFLAATPDLVFSTDKVGNILLLGRERGQVIGSLPFRQFNAYVKNDRTDRLYLATQGGLVVCIREKSREEPLWHMFPDRQPIRATVAADDDAEAMPSESAENPFANP